MNFSTITKWELKETLKSKKFLTIFILQISVLFLMIFVFNAFAANIQSQGGLSITPSLSGFTSMYVDDQGHLFSKYINPQLIDVKSSNYNNSIKILETGGTTGFVQVSPDSIERIRDINTTDVQLYLDQNDPRSSVIRDEVNTTAQLMSNAISSSWIDSLTPANSTPPVNQQNTGEPLQLQIITKAMIAILLFVPLFLFGNLVVDSVVGEKERKTGEILVAMPISSFDIVLGKSMAVVGVIAIQVVLWMIILLGAGFVIVEPVLVFLLVMMSAVPVIGVTFAIAVYCKNYKEAGIGLTAAYILAVAILLIPPLVYLANKSLAANISPLTVVMRLFSGETIPLWQYIIPVVTILVVSLISYWISITLFERDDVLFGPRPGLLRLSLELIGLKKRKINY